MHLEQLDRLHRLNWSHTVAKFGGQSIGRMSDRQVIGLLRTIISATGKPVGVVFSAPQGITMRLKDLLASMDDGSSQLRRVKDEMRSIATEMGMMWMNAKTDMMLATASPSVQHKLMPVANSIENERRMKIATIMEDAIVSLASYAAEASSTEPNKQNMDRLTARILSVGERLFGASVIEPITLIFSEIYDIKCLYLDPKSYIRPQAHENGFSGVMPDIEQSVISLHRDLFLRQQAGSGQSMVFMPGYYMGSESGKDISTMPFNGSDMTAYILTKALNYGPPLPKGFERLQAHLSSRPYVRLLYVKHVDGPVAETTTKLIGVQKSNDGRELVMGEVLEHLLKDGDSFSVFDPRTLQVFVVRSTIMANVE